MARRSRGSRFPRSEDRGPGGWRAHSLPFCSLSARGSTRATGIGRCPMMNRTLALVLSLALLGCQERVGPDTGATSAAKPALAYSAVDQDRSPPAPWPFGPDSYRTGVFTGEGLT